MGKGVVVVEFDQPENEQFVQAVEQIVSHLDLEPGRQPVSIRIAFDQTAETVIEAFEAAQRGQRSEC